MKTITITRRLSLFAAFLAIAVSMLAAPEAEYRKLSKSYTLHADGSQEYRYNMELTLFTHTAMNNTYGETFIVYNPECQELKIHDSYTQQKDGTIIRTPDNAFVEVLPRNAANAPAYNHLKEMVVVHTGLELGATIYLDYSIITKAGVLPEIDFQEKLCQTSPVKEYTLTVNLPENKTLQYAVVGRNAKAKESIDGGVKTMTWQWKNLPASTIESMTDINSGDIPYLVATTYPTPGEALSVIGKQLASDDDPQLSLIAENLIGESEDEEEQLKTILHYVQHELASVPTSASWTQFRFRNVNDVINTAYGTSLEKINLLSGLLNAAGLNATPVAYYSLHADRGLGLNAVSDYYVYCKAGNQEYLLNVSNTQRPQVDLTHPGALIRISDGQPQPINWPEAYAIKAQTDITFQEGQPVATTRQQTGSLLLPYFTAEEKTVNTQHHWTSVDNYATLQLNDAREGVTYRQYGKFNTQRSTHLLLDQPIDETYDYTIDCPEGYTLKTKVGSKTISNQLGTFTLTISAEGNKIQFHRSLKIDKSLIAPSDYRHFRALMTEWDDVSNQTLVFGK